MQKALVTLALLGTIGAAQAAHLEIGAGHTYFKKVGNGTWYQSGFPYTMNLQSPTALIGVTGSFSRHFGYHLDYAYLGRASVNSWDTPSDANYAALAHGEKCWPLSNFTGHGSASAFVLDLSTRMREGHWHFSVLLGPDLYRTTWTETVYKWEPCRDCRQRTIQVHETNNQYELGYNVGLNIRYKGVWGRVSYYALPQSRASVPTVFNGATTIMAGYRF